MAEPQPTGGAHAYRPAPTQAELIAENQSLGDIMGDVTRDLSTLMRQEVELAKAELKESATKAGKGTGMYAGAGVAGHFTLLFLSVALIWALSYLVGLGWAAVVVAVIWAVIAAVLAAKGKKEMQQVRGMPQTAETIKDIPPTLNQVRQPHDADSRRNPGRDRTHPCRARDKRRRPRRQGQSLQHRPAPGPESPQHRE